MTLLSGLTGLYSGTSELGLAMAAESLSTWCHLLNLFFSLAGFSLFGKGLRKCSDYSSVNYSCWLASKKLWPNRLARYKDNLPKPTQGRREGAQCRAQEEGNPLPLLNSSWWRLSVTNRSPQTLSSKGNLVLLTFRTQKAQGKCVQKPT